MEKDRYNAARAQAATARLDMISQAARQERAAAEKQAEAEERAKAQRDAQRKADAVAAQEAALKPGREL